MKVYISGHVSGSYRGQNILKTLADAKIPFHYFPKTYLRVTKGGLILTAFLALLFLPYRFVSICLASHIIVLPMSFSPLTVIDIVIGKVFRKTLIVDFYISLYDTHVIDRKDVKIGSFKSTYLKWVDQFYFKYADKLMFMNISEAKRYQSILDYSLPPKKINIVPLCVDLKNECVSTSSDIYRDCKIFNVFWWGTYIPLHGLEKVISAFVELKGKPIQLYIYGNDSEKSLPYKQLAESVGVTDQVHFCNTISFLKGGLAKKIIEGCDLALGNFGDSPKAKMVLPNKVVDALSLGVPCLTFKTDAAEEVFTHGFDIYFSNNTPEDIAQEIIEISQNKESLANVAAQGQLMYFRVFSPEAFRSLLLNVLGFKG